MKVLNVAFIGFGNVGQSLASLLEQKRGELESCYRIKFRTTGVATRSIGWLVGKKSFEGSSSSWLAGASNIRRANNITAWLAAAKPDVVFEATSTNAATGQPAIDHIRAGLSAGAHVITANKGPNLYAYRELSALAARKGRQYLFEATCMGGVPLFSLSRLALPAAKLIGFRGILNCTSSIILEHVEKGNSFEAGVKYAQQLGVAETDPSADIDGWDSALKVCGIATVLMGSPLHPRDIALKGIRGITVKAVRRAAANKTPIRLVSEIVLRNGKAAARVRPEKIAMNDPLVPLESRDIVGTFKYDVISGLTIRGHGLGPSTTAYDMMADFIRAVSAQKITLETKTQ